MELVLQEAENSGPEEGGSSSRAPSWADWTKPSLPASGPGPGLPPPYLGPWACPYLGPPYLRAQVTSLFASVHGPQALCPLRPGNTGVSGPHGKPGVKARSQTVHPGPDSSPSALPTSHATPCQPEGARARKGTHWGTSEGGLPGVLACPLNSERSQETEFQAEVSFPQCWAGMSTERQGRNPALPSWVCSGFPEDRNAPRPFSGLLGAPTTGAVSRLHMGPGEEGLASFLEAAVQNRASRVTPATWPEQMPCLDPVSSSLKRGHACVHQGPR